MEWNKRFFFTIKPKCYILHTIFKIIIVLLSLGQIHIKSIAMELSEITQAIKLWDKSRDNVDLIKALFNQGNAFKFNYIKNTPTNAPDTFLNAYLGVLNIGDSKTLKLFLINSDRDNKEQHISPEGILPYISVIDIFSAPDTLPIYKKDEVDPIEARQRIQRWLDNSNEWVRHQIDSSNDIHQIFAMPTRYLKEKEYQAYFALNRKIPGPHNDISEYKGDMIVWDLKDKVISLPFETTANDYYNTVRLVPPFGQQDKDSFYLLKLANETPSV